MEGYPTLALAAFLLAVAITPSHAATPAEAARVTLPTNYSCGPSMGLAAHGPLPIVNRTGWWYFVCSGELDTGLSVWIYHAIMETWIVSPDGSASDQLIGVHAVAIPSYPEGKRFFSYQEITREPNMDWQRIPVNITSGAINIFGSPNFWHITADIDSKEGPNYGLDFELKYGQRTAHVARFNDTGCVTCSDTDGGRDIFYWSTVGLSVKNGLFRMPGKSKWNHWTGTCHYDRQQKTGAPSTIQTLWKWGESTFYDSLPKGFEMLAGRHSAWWGMYLVVGSESYLYQAYMGISSYNTRTVEYTNVTIEVLGTTYVASANATVASDLLLTINDLGISFRGTVSVPEAIQKFAKLTDGYNVQMRYLEGPCTYSAKVGNKWVQIGFGTIEVLIDSGHLM